MADNVIKQFLVGLGFSIDPKSEKKFNESIDFATAKAVALGEAMYDAAKEVTAAVVSMAQDMDQLYWKTQRLNSSAADIKAYGYAMSQLGSSTQGAQAMLESLAEFAKSSPGAQGFLRRLGVSPEDMGDAVAMARDLSATFQSMPYFRAKAFASVIGIDPIQLQAMMRDQGQFEDQYKDFAQKLGIDLDEVTGKANEFATQLREMKAEAGLAFDVALYKGLEWLLPKLEALSKWVQDTVSGKKLTGLAGEFQKLVANIRDLLHALGELAGTPYMQNFAEKMESAVNHMVRSLTGLVKLITDVLNGNWSAAWNDVQNIGSNVAGIVGDLGAGAIGYGSDRYRRSGSTDPISDPNNLTPDWMSGGANDNGGRGYRPGGRTADSNTPKAQRAEQLLMASGFSAPAAKGIAAVLWAESGLNERRFNDAGSGAFGLAQWLTKSRVAEFARKFGHSIYQSTFAEQIQFVAHEMNTTHKAVGDRIKGMRDAMQIAAVVIDQFEAPGPAGARGDLRRAGQYLGVSGMGRGVAINQKTDIHVSGSDARQIANDIAHHQDSVNQRLVTNASRFAY